MRSGWSTGRPSGPPDEAHLIGIFTNLLPDLAVAMPMDGGAAAMQVLTELEDKARQDGDANASV